MFGKQRAAFWTQRTHLFRPDVYECSACGYEAKNSEIIVKISVKIV